MNYLKIEKRKRGEGEYVYCSKCKANIDNICKLNNKKISTCKFPQRHVFKASYYVPGSGNKRIMEYFSTRDYDTFKDLARSWLKRMKSLNITPQNLEAVKRMLKNEKLEKKQRELPVNFSPQTLPTNINLTPVLPANLRPGSKKDLLQTEISFKKASKIFLDFMADVGVPVYEHKKFSKNYLEEVSRNLNHFATSLTIAKKNAHTFLFRKIGQKEVEAFHIFLTESLNDDGSKRFGDHSYNKAMLIMKKLFEYFIKKKKVPTAPLR